MITNFRCVEMKKTVKVQVPCDHLKFINLEIITKILRRNEIFERKRG